MARFGFCGGSYTSQSSNADAQRTMNWIPESVESGSGKSAVVLHPTPGTKLFVELPEAPVRGKVAINTRCFAVGGTKFCELSADGTYTVRGTVISDLLPVSLAAGPTQVLVASAGRLYVFVLADNSFVEIKTDGSDALQGLVAMVAYSDGYFIALLKDSNKWQVSNLLDATTWDPTQIAETSVFPDDLQSLLVSHREPWLFGRTKTQPYYDSGNLFPYDIIQGATIEQGIAASLSAVRADNSVLWLGQDERGQGIAWKAQGYVPARISGHAQEWAWSQYPTISDAVGYSYQDSGHTFWVLYFPSANGGNGATWVYDIATALWHERGYCRDGRYEAHHSQCHAFAFGKHLVGDWSSGKVYEMSTAHLDDDGQPIRRLRRAPYISLEGQWIYFFRLEVEGEFGDGPIPPLAGTSQNRAYLPLADNDGAAWALTIGDDGRLTINPAAYAIPEPLVLNDTESAQSWQITILDGNLVASLVPYVAGYPDVIELATTGGKDSGVMVTNGQIMTLDPKSVGRGPQLMLRWSDDGCKTWSNEYWVSAGEAGEYTLRAIWRRMGRCWGTRGRVYELVASDPVPWRLTDAYIEASPNYAPTERMAAQLRKMA